MAQLVEYVDELVQEVGPRPAGTQQEHQAAELIAARLDEFGMKVDIEEFSCVRNIGWVRVLYYALCVGGAALSIFMASLRIVGLIVIVVGVAFMLLDYLGKNPLFSLFRNSLSQNVIARYLPPGVEPSKRSRKVVILAHYDSARMMVQAAPSLAPHYAQLRRVIRVVMGVLAGLVLLAFVPFPAVVQTALQILTGVLAGLVFLALLIEVINCFTPYNLGANCNGSSVGVLYGLAQMLSSNADGASLRNAAARGRQGRSAREGSTRSSRVPQDSGDSADERDARVTQGARGGHVVRNRRERHGEKGEQSLASTARAAQELAAAAEHATPVEQGKQTQGAFPQAMTTERSVQSVADNLVTANPFVSQRPALAEIEEAERQRKEEEEARRLREAQEAAQASDGMPAWFTKAKQNAEKNVERKRHDPDEGKIVRSRFADMPVSGRLLKDEPLTAAGAAAAAAVAPGASASATTAAPTAPAPATEAAAGTPGAPAAAPAPTSASVSVPAGAATTPTVSSAAPAPATIPAAPAPTAMPHMEPEAIIKSMPAGQRASAPAAVAQVAQVTQVTAKPDFTGLDRQAFSVLSRDVGSGDAVIVPSEVGAIGKTATASVGGGTPAVNPISDSSAPAGVGGISITPSAPAGVGSIPSTPLTAAPTTSITDDASLSREARLFGNGNGASTLQESLLTGPRSRLRNLPGLSQENTGNIPGQQATLDTELVAKEDLFSTQGSVVSATGAFVPLGTTGVMKPIGEDLLNYHDSGEIYILDADDTSIAEHYSETGEYSEPELLNIPDSRVKSFFSSVGNRFSGKKKEKLDSSPSSWLGVDQGFNARREGNQIGSWENFNAEDDENWNGGAYGGASHEENVGAMMDLSQGLMDREVWLVALGANSSKNAGLVNLFANHDSELKNALFINLLGVGTGDLVFTIAEGNYRPVQTDHRMQNLISGAAQSMAIPIGPVKFSAFATDGTETLKRGGRAISIMRLGSQLPVGWRWSDNDVAQLREDNLLDVAALVLETIKNS
jgi:hypothetical protein